MSRVKSGALRSVINKLLTGTASVIGVSSIAVFGLVTASAQAGVTTRVDVDSTGREAQGSLDTERVDVSATGRYVAFSSQASNLVPGDTNGARDIFVHDRQTGQTTRVSVDSAGQQANGSSWSPAMSADGRYIAFESWATNLVAGDTNQALDVFVHDRQTKQTTRVSVSSAGQQGHAYAWSRLPAVSADGRYVVFESVATNLVPGIEKGGFFIHDRDTGKTTLVRLYRAGESWIGGLLGSAVSADGRYVAFASNLPNPVPGVDEVGVFVHDRDTGQTRLVSVDSAGLPGNGAAYAPALSADGRYVAFCADASNLVPGDINDQRDVFVHDRQTGQTTLVSVNSTGVQGNYGSEAPALSADGRYVAFLSGARNFVPEDTDLFADIFVHDRQTGQTTRVSVDSAGEPGNSYHDREPALSGDGRYVAFSSHASNLVPGDTNSYSDVFVHDRFATLLEGPYGLTTCSDGLDNDIDGNADASDTDCQLPPPPHMCQGKRVTIIGTPGDDHYFGTPDHDVISSFGGNDIVDGGWGRDTICGGSGNDTLKGDASTDALYGGLGDDTLLGGGANDKLHGGQGTDLCNGGAGTDTNLGSCETSVNLP